MDSNWLRVCKHLRLGLITLTSSSTHYARTLRLRFAPPLSVPDVQNPPAPLFHSPCLSLCLFVCVLALTRRSRLALSAPRRLRGRVTCVFSAFQCCMLMLTSTHCSTPPPHSFLLCSHSQQVVAPRRSTPQRPAQGSPSVLRSVVVDVLIWRTLRALCFQLLFFFSLCFCCFFFDFCLLRAFAFAFCLPFVVLFLLLLLLLLWLRFILFALVINVMNLLHAPARPLPLPSCPCPHLHLLCLCSSFYCPDMKQAACKLCFAYPVMKG